jgi:hypothetical protein
MPTPLKLIAIIALLQPLYLAMLIATDFIASPQARMLHLQVQPPISINEDSECGAQSIGLEPGASPLRNAIVAPSPRAKTTAMTLCEALHRTAIGDLSNIVWVPLDRYWHGYRVVIDPLTAWFSWRSTRLVALALLASALVYFTLASAELIGWTATIVLLVPTLAFSDLRWLWTQTYCVPPTCLIFAGSGWFARRIGKGSDLLVAAAVLGSIFNFLDLLTNPPWQPMLLAFFMLAAGKGLKGTAAVLACWLAGYALTWATKWGIAVIYGGDWNYIWQTILFRIDGSYEQVVDHRPFASSVKVIGWLAAQSDYWWTVALLVPLLIVIAPRPDFRRWALLALPALIPFVWFEVLRNHTQIHAWFAYRPVATSIGIVLAAWALAERKAVTVPAHPLTEHYSPVP